MYSILIIEDDPASMRFAEVILQKEGFEVFTATSGKAGLAMLRKRRVDVILCDIMMPDMDGHMVLETLKLEPALAAIPFIFVTAMNDRADVRLGMSAGADDYLSKPFSAYELLAAVSGRIRRHEKIRQDYGKSAHQEMQAILRQRITRREREILRMVGQGNTSRKIAERLGICVKTVEAHRTNMMNKLDTVNAAALTRWAIVAEQMDDE